MRLPPSFLRSLQGAAAAATWPVFSRTSHRMVWGLRAQGLHPATVLDVGANRGQFAVAARRLWADCTVHAFEPSPDLAARLRGVAAADPHLVVHAVALGDAPGWAELHLNAHHQSSSLLTVGARHLSAFPEAREVGSVRVGVERLDARVDAAALRRPVLAKVDVQGTELAVLAGAGAVLDRIDHLVVETSFTPLYEGEPPFAELLAWAERHGFAFDRPVGLLRDPATDEILQIDALLARR